MKRNGEITIRDAVRATLRSHGKPVSVYAVWDGLEQRLRKVFTRARVNNTLAQMVFERDVIGTGRGEKRTYQLNPERVQ